VREEFHKGNREDAEREHREVVMRAASGKDTERHHIIRGYVESIGPASQLTRQSLTNIKARTLILWCNDDKVTKPHLANILRRELPDSELYMMDKGGHLPHYTMYEEVAHRVTAFFGKR
jgi:pimeloyl-ACP methyl ester carboxylesterase